MMRRFETVIGDLRESTLRMGAYSEAILVKSMQALQRRDNRALYVVVAAIGLIEMQTEASP